MNFFTVLFIDFLLVHENKKCLQAYLDNSFHKIVNKQMIDDNPCYLGDNPFETDGF